MTLTIIVHFILYMSHTIVLDVETTGIPKYRGVKPFIISNFESARLIEIGYILINNTTNIIDKKVSRLINSNLVITNSDIHGITNEMIEEDGEPLEIVLHDLFEDLKHVDKIVAHNISFDLSIILSELYRIYNTCKLFDPTKLIGLIYLAQHVCTMKFCSNVFTEFNKYPKLIHLHKLLFPNRDMIQNHRALDDVLLCYDVYTFFKNKGFVCIEKPTQKISIQTMQI